jgi:hypothetical protein
MAWLYNEIVTSQYASTAIIYTIYDGLFVRCIATDAVELQVNNILTPSYEGASSSNRT